MATELGIFAKKKGWRGVAFELDDLWQARWRGFDCVIDVRAPAEFAEDHIPGAVSMPVLDDAERARVGTIYKQDSAFTARKIGAALVARNAAAHIEAHMMDRPGAWKPLVYCWRGGQRSGSFATILRQIGWRVGVLEGGYRSYRRGVVEALYERPFPFRLIRLDGNTGTGKTALLRRASAMGAQVLDLEGLAQHRGSILGGMGADQPAQKGFESKLISSLIGFDRTKPVLVEAESGRLGALRLPPSLWKAMISAPRIVVRAPVAARASFLISDYSEVLKDREKLSALLDGLRPLVGHDRVSQWQTEAKAGSWSSLAQGLIRDHYDPAYGRARQRDKTPVCAELATERLDETSLDRLARKLLATVDDVDFR